VVAREVEVEDDVKHYVNSVVPVVVEKQSGEVGAVACMSVCI
jgi:hypothetical protein